MDMAHGHGNEYFTATTPTRKKKGAKFDKQPGGCEKWMRHRALQSLRSETAIAANIG
jgi:hypothetical protein